MQRDAKERVRAFFGRHAGDYSRSESHRAGPDLRRLIELLDTAAPRRCLDLATGAGATAIALAREGLRVTALDLTREMGAQALANAGVAGVRIVLVVGDVEALPFPIASFDLVTCRRAAHHFARPAAALGEAARVLRPGGVLALVDMTTPEDRAAADLMNALERARDGSHVRALGPAEWVELATAAGFGIDVREVLLDRVPYSVWLAPVEPGGEEDLRARRLLAAADEAVAGEILESGQDGDLVLKRRVLLVAHRP